MTSWNPSAPAVEKIDFDFGSQNHSLIIVQTGKGHADLSADYSSVPNEMKNVAQFFGKEVLSQVTEEEVISNLAEVQPVCRRPFRAAAPCISLRRTRGWKQRWQP